MARQVSGLSVDACANWLERAPKFLLKQLRAEIIAIERTFPELALRSKRRAVRRTIKTARRSGRRMSAAARQAVSVRMKKYWAERKKAQAKVK